jgi:hypothetical protein
MEGGVGCGGVQVVFSAAAEVDLDRVEAPRRERVDVLLVVAVAALARSPAPMQSRIGVEADQQTGRMQRPDEPREAVRPLGAADVDLAVWLAGPLPM